jgi:hypothetical protein
MAFLHTAADPPGLIAGDTPLLIAVYSELREALDKLEELEAGFRPLRRPPEP